MYRIFNGKSNLQCCPDGYLTLNGSFDRRIRTSLGEFKMDFWRVRCSKCGKCFTPLAKFIGLEHYQTKTHELEKLVVDAASGTNYRMAVKDLERDGKLPVSFHTAHARVMRSDCNEIKISPKTVGSAPIQIMPDGDYSILFFCRSGHSFLLFQKIGSNPSGYFWQFMSQ